MRSWASSLRVRAALLAALAAVQLGAAQNTSPFAIYNETKRLPAGCVDGYTAGSDTVIYTVPYTYTQVLSIIGSFKNLTWSGNPDSTVTLNGTNNTPGTARFYSTPPSGGIPVIETLVTYSSPAAGPYIESHTLAPLTVPAASSPNGSPLSFYSSYDANTATPVCNGAATMFNETVTFCATDPVAAAKVFHTLHLADVKGVGTLLGGSTFTTCEAAKALHPGLVAPVVGGSNGTANGTATGNATVATTATTISTGSLIPSASTRPSGSSVSVSVPPPPPPSTTPTPAATATTVATGAGSVLVGNTVLAGLMVVLLGVMAL